MRKLKGGEDDTTPQSHSKPKHSSKAKNKSSTSQVQSSLDDLLNMLECPICLETADTPPIYQCSEGHLLCKVGGRMTKLTITYLTYIAGMQCEDERVSTVPPCSDECS